jgi:hypothetical protein
MTFIYIIIKDKKKSYKENIYNKIIYITMSDNYEFEKAMQSQTTHDYSPYVDKQSNGYIDDINNGIEIIV